MTASPGREMARITLTMTLACAIGAAVLGGAYVGTERYQRAAQLRTERHAITELLGLGPAAVVTEVRQYLVAAAPGREGAGEVLYEARPLGAEAAAAGPGGAAPARAIAFSLDGQPASAAAAAADRKRLEPLGRLFVARQDGHAAGFVVEGSTRGYKNRIRFLVALSPGFEITGVRVVEHEEDPGLGAEVATRVFQGQFFGRSAAELPALGVTRDPMPEDWRAALLRLERTPPAEWKARNAALVERERRRPIYAVTGATISSRALTDGVRSTVDHFRRRWTLLEPYLGGAS